MTTVRLARPTLLAGGTVLVLLAVSAGLCLGPVHFSVSTLVTALTGDGHPAVREVVLQLRLPRVVLGLLVGACLASSGAAVQALFRNPLAEPGLIGISAGAALGAAAVFTVLPATFGASGTIWLLPLAAFAGAGACAALISAIAATEGDTRISTLLLAGLALNAIAGGGVAAMATLASSPALRNLTLWLFGNLDFAGWKTIALSAPFLLLPTLWLPRRAHQLDALLLGEAPARHLGVPVARLKRELLLVVVVGTGAAVAVSGVIGFVGLLMPHLARMLAGPRHRSVLPGAALLGAALLVGADTVARSALAPAELPVGVMTALIGGPCFLLLLLQLRARSDRL